MKKQIQKITPNTLFFLTLVLHYILRVFHEWVQCVAGEWQVGWREEKSQNSYPKLHNILEGWTTGWLVDWQTDFSKKIIVFKIILSTSYINLQITNTLLTIINTV